MADVLVIVIPWAVTTWAIFALIARDEARLPPEQLARAWLPASRVCAIVFFSVFAVPVHFWRTRRGLRGCALGLAWGVALFALNYLCAVIVDALTG